MLLDIMVSCLQSGFTITYVLVHHLMPVFMITRDETLGPAGVAHKFLWRSGSMSPPEMSILRLLRVGFRHSESFGPKVAMVAQTDSSLRNLSCPAENDLLYIIHM